MATKKKSRAQCHTQIEWIEWVVALVRPGSGSPVQSLKPPVTQDVMYPQNWVVIRRGEGGRARCWAQQLCRRPISKSQRRSARSTVDETALTVSRPAVRYKRATLARVGTGDQGVRVRTPARIYDLRSTFASRALAAG